VHVAGRVLRPGVVHLPAGARVIDAVAAVGGVTAGADAARINLARPLADGEQVLVLAEGEPAPALGPGSVGPPAGAGAPASVGGPALVDLNTATLADLDTLPGVGPVLAQRILDWRRTNGRFTSVDELREITGVGEKRLADLRGKVTV
jgi:competence protein ComEA